MSLYLVILPVYANAQTRLQYTPAEALSFKYDRMSGASKQFLSDADLNDLLLYFQYMAKHKVTSAQPLRK